MITKSKSISKVLIVLGVILAVIAAVVMTVVLAGHSREKKLQTQLDLGNKYLAEEQYEDAIVAFEAAISIEPKTPEAYKGLAEAYEAMGDYEAAKEALQRGIEATADEGLKDYKESIEEEQKKQEAAEAEARRQEEERKREQEEKEKEQKILEEMRTGDQSSSDYWLTVDFDKYADDFVINGKSVWNATLDDYIAQYDLDLVTLGNYQWYEKGNISVSDDEDSIYFGAETYYGPGIVPTREKIEGTGIQLGQSVDEAMDIMHFTDIAKAFYHSNKYVGIWRNLGEDDSIQTGEWFFVDVNDTLIYWSLKGYKNIHPDALWDGLVVELMVNDEGIITGIHINAYNNDEDI